MIENFATDQQKRNQYDLADYLIEQQKEINEFNEFIDFYNSKLETVWNDESLNLQFNLILDEQKAIAVYNGLSELEAEKQCTQADFMRFAVRSV